MTEGSPPPNCHVSHVMCHMSCVTCVMSCHASHVSHVSRVTSRAKTRQFLREGILYLKIAGYFFFQGGGGMQKKIKKIKFF